MKKAIILIFSCWSLLSCGQSGGGESSESEAVVSSAEEVAQGNKTETEAGESSNSATASAEKGMKKADFDFLTGCNSLEIWRGGIQGVPTSDAAGIFIMAQCSTNKHYDLILFSDRTISLGEAANTGKGSLKKGLPGATYYAFEIPKKEAVDPEDEMEAFEYIFPSEVKVYQLSEGGWYLINTKEVSSFEQLGRLKLNTIHQKQPSSPNT